ncbi:GlxA family transcriptional regulator [Tropicimonas aquimaris]|uniref:GlxA family transcriptional regulator n=1 Tax=Tropicimonas aquimaris TaxID=914152 RepID=A0ABW3ITN8_9RHOB
MLKWTNSLGPPVSVTILIFDRFSHLCLANCVEPLQAANRVARARAFDVKIVTLDGAPVQSSSGTQVVPHSKLSEMPAYDALIILASYDHLRHDTRATRRALVAASQKARVTAALDAAPWLLASAGLLDGRQATLHWDLIEAFSETFLAVAAERTNVVRDGPFVTCAGVLAAMDLSLGLVEQSLGVAARMSVNSLYARRDYSTAAWSENAADPMVTRALDLMRNNFEHPLSLDALAYALSCQPRTLNRRFRSRLGAPPGKVYRHLRLASARTMLESRALSVAEVSVRCGYESPAALARAIRREYGATPSQLRAGQQDGAI